MLLPKLAAPADAKSIGFDIEEISGEFHPQQIIHCKYSLVFGATIQTPNKLTIHKTMKTYETLSRDIQAYVADYLSGHVRHTQISNPPQPSGPGSTPLDIGVEKQCYVVVELDNTCNWALSWDRDAIQLKLRGYPGENGEVRHVPHTGGAHSPDPLPGEKCQLAYFAVVRRSDRGNRRFNFNVRLVDVEEGYAVELIIDPDIPNTGANPTIP